MYLIKLHNGYNKTFIYNICNTYNHHYYLGTDLYGLKNAKYEWSNNFVHIAYISS